MNVPATYFEEMYRTSDDPWSLASRWYERRKYDLTVAALPRARYLSAFEPGCSVGELSVRLAGRCESLLSCDREARAVGVAGAKLRDHPNVRVERRLIPEEWPAGSFDLIVLSEILYYFDAETLRRLLDRVAGSLSPGGTLAAVHWRHPVAEHAQSAQAVHSAVLGLADLVPVVRHAEPDFLLDVFVRPDPDGADGPAQGSVAAAEGLH
jgi:cyclopropane fatty-acyl-phospholipid synthase-like methyltransferase